MNTRKLFLTSLLAAATMSVSAFSASWPSEFIDSETGRPKDTNFAPVTLNADGTTTLTGNSAVTSSADSSATIDTGGNAFSFTSTKGNDNNEMTFSGAITGGGAVWFDQGRIQVSNAAVFNDAGDVYVRGPSQLQFKIQNTSAENPVVFRNNFTLGTSSIDSQANAALRVGSWSGSDLAVTATLDGTTTILAEGTKIGFQSGSTLNISNLTGSGDITTGVWSGSNNLNITGATSYTGKISVVSGVTLNWSTNSSFGGLSGNGSVAAGSKLNIANAKDGSTFAGTVGASGNGNGVALSLTGTGTQAFTGTSYFSTVSVADTATLNLGGTTTISDATTVTGGTLALSGTTNIAGTTTVGAGGKLNLSGARVSLANEIQNSGTVTISDATVFNLTQTGVTMLITGSGTIDGFDWNRLTSSNFTYNGVAIAARGLTSSAAGVVSYDVSAATAKALTWTGADSSVWKAVTITETPTATPWQDGSTAEAFYNGDSVTFDTANASVMVSGTVKPAALTVSENTTFKGTDATISVAKDSLTISGSATLGIDSGVTLDLGSGSDAIGSSAPPLALSGSGTVKYTFTRGDGDGSGIFIADSFTGIVDYYGNLNWAVNSCTISDSATIRLSKTASQTEACLWSRAAATFKNAFAFGSDYKIATENGQGMTFEGSVDASGKTLTIEGTNPVTFKGTTTMDKIVNKGKTRVESSAFTITGTGTNDNGSLNYGVFEIGTGSTVSFSADFKGSAWAGVDIAKTLTVEENATLNVGGILINASGLLLTNNGMITATQIDYASQSGWEKTVNNVSGSGYIVTDKFKIYNQTKFVFQNNRFVIGALEFAANGDARFGNATFGAKQDWSTNKDFALTGTAGTETTTTVFNTGVFDAGTKTFSETDGRTITLGGVLSGKGGIEKAGAGTLKLSGNNIFEGGVKLEAGTLELGHNKALGSAALTIQSGMLAPELKLGTDASGNALTISNNLSVLGLGTVTVSSAHDGNELSGSISASGQEIRKVGSGTLTLSGTNTGESVFIVNVAEGKIIAKTDTALGAGMGAGVADYHKVRLSGGQLEVGSGVTLAQTNIEIVLSDAYSSTAAITGDGALATGATITIADIQAAAIAAESALGNDSWTFQIATENSTIATSLAKENFVLAETLQDRWQISAYTDGVLTIAAIPEPSVFGLLAGLGALALAGTRRRRRKA